MDFSLDEDQRIVKETFQRFMQKECSSQLVRAWEESDLGYSPELWEKMAELGWLGMSLSDQYGGFGGEFLYLVFLHEEMGRVLFASPHFSTVVMAGQIINACDQEDLKAHMLPKIAAGEMIVAPALLEERRVFDPGKAGLTAGKDNEIYVLKGKKRYVENAHITDYFLCSARIAGGEERDLTLFLLPAKRSGIRIDPMNVIGGAKFFEVAFENVQCSQQEILGGIHGGQELIFKNMDQWKIVHSARMLGSAQGAFDMTLKYSKERVQFGSRIALFQDISFRLADMATQLEGIRFLLYEAGWKVDQGMGVRKEAAMIKALISDLYRHVTAEAIQIHGGFGFMLEADPQLFYRRAKVDEALFGDSAANWKIVSKEVLRPDP